MIDHNKEIKELGISALSYDLVHDTLRVYGCSDEPQALVMRRRLLEHIAEIETELLSAQEELKDIHSELQDCEEELKESIKQCEGMKRYTDYQDKMFNALSDSYDELEKKYTELRKERGFFFLLEEEAKKWENSTNEKIIIHPADVTSLYTVGGKMYVTVENYNKKKSIVFQFNSSLKALYYADQIKGMNEVNSLGEVRVDVDEKNGEGVEL